MNQVDPKESEKAKEVLGELATVDFLKSEIGWQAIELLAQNSTDPYGKFFMDNRDFYKNIIPAEDFKRKEEQLLRYAMYGYLRSGDKEEFDKGLTYFSQEADHDKQVEVAMFKVEWIATHGTEKEFIKYTNDLRKGLLKEEDERLSFIGRRYSGKYATGKKTSDAMLKQCYVLAKQAAELNEMSYSNQGTLAEICISLNKKKEAVQAAENARALAELETSKIVKIADALLARAQAL